MEYIAPPSPTRKVTLNLPQDLVERAMAETGKPLTETMRMALEKLARQQAFKRLRAARGKVQFQYSGEALRQMDDE